MIGSTVIKSVVKVAAVVAVLIGLALTTAWIFRVPASQYLAETGLQLLGFSDASLTVVSFELDEVVLDDLFLDEKVKAGRISATYTFSELVDGSVESLTIEDGFTDLSDPQAEIFGKIRALIKADENTTKSQVKLPTIQFRNLRVVRQNSKQMFEAVLNGQLDEKLTLHASALIEGKLKTPTGPINLEKTEAILTGSLQNLEGDITLKGVRLSQSGEDAAFNLLEIDLVANVDVLKVSFDANIKTDQGTTLARFRGFHEITTNVGRAEYQIDDLVFDRDVLQPSHLLPTLNEIPKFNAHVNSTGEIQWDADTITTQGSILLKELSVFLTQGQIVSNSPQIEFHITADTKGTPLKSEASLRAPDLTATLDGQTYDVGALKVTAHGQGLDAIEILIDAELEKTPHFPSVTLKSTIETIAGNIKFSGEIVGNKIPLKIEGRGQHSLSGGGDAHVVLNSIKFQPNKLQPRHLSSLLLELKEDLSGVISGTANIRWGADFVPSVQLKAHVINAAYQADNITLQNVNAVLETTYMVPSGPFSITGKEISGKAEADTRNFEFAGGNLKANFLQNWKSGDFVLKALKIIPGDGMNFKLFVTVSAQGALRSNVGKVSGSVKTDLLGKFVEFSGDYHLQKNAGDMDVNLLNIPFDDEGLTPDDLIRGAPENLIVNGEVGGDMHLSFSENGVQNSGSIRLSDVSVAQDGLKVSGLNGNIKMDSLDPITISDLQEITASEIFAGFLIERPALKFRLKTRDASPVLYIDDLKFGVFGGSADIKDAIIDTSAEVNTLELELSSLALDELLALSDLEGVAATGQLRGTIPLTFDGEKLTVKLGVLESDGPGKLEIKSDKARQALSAGGAQTKLLFDVLENFNYSELSLKIKKPASGEDLVTLHTKGANPDVENNRAVILNVNLSTNLDRIFNTLLDGYRLSEKALRATVRSRNK